MVIYLQKLKEFLIQGEAIPDIGYRISQQLDCTGICISLYKIPTYNHITVHVIQKTVLLENHVSRGQPVHKKMFHVKPARILNVRNIHLHGFKLATLRLTCLWSLNSHMYYVLNSATHILRKYFQYICGSSLFAIYAQVKGTCLNDHVQPFCNYARDAKY